MFGINMDLWQLSATRGTLLVQGPHSGGYRPPLALRPQPVAWHPPAVARTGATLRITGPRGQAPLQPPGPGAGEKAAWLMAPRLGKRT